MATEFTLFPQLITELRLHIWRMALPVPISNLLYPFKKGCWTYGDLGLEPDPNGEDLYMEFDTNLLEPLRVELPLYSVNREARDVVAKYLQQQDLVARRGSSEYEFLRHFDSRLDTMFVPTEDVDTFIMDLIERRHEPDLLERFVGTSSPILPRLAVTPSGLEALKSESLETVYDAAGTIGILYVVDIANMGMPTSQALQTPACARLIWRSSRKDWDNFGDETIVMELRKLIEGLLDVDFTSSYHDLEVRLIRP